MNEMNNMIYIIVGHTGAGKTTVAKKLSEFVSLPLLTFSGLGKQLATSKGYKRLRDYFTSNSSDIFKSELNKFLIEKIHNQKDTSPQFIIEGLISSEVIEELRSQSNNILVFYLHVPRKVRIQRISKRLSCTYEEAESEEDLKNNIKETLGIYEVIEKSDYTIDGTQETGAILEEILRKANSPHRLLNLRNDRLIAIKN